MPTRKNLAHRIEARREAALERLQNPSYKNKKKFKTYSAESAKKHAARVAQEINTLQSRIDK